MRLPIGSFQDVIDNNASTENILKALERTENESNTAILRTQEFREFINGEGLRSTTRDVVNELIDNGVIELDIEQKLNDLETQYAPQLNQVTSDLNVVSGELTNKVNQSDILKTYKANQYGLNKISSGLLNTVSVNDVKIWYSGSAFENTPIPTQINDVSGNGNDGIVSGFAFNSTSGSNGTNGIVTDGLTSFFATKPNAGLTNQFTISLSININEIPSSSGRVLSLNNDNIYVGLGSSQYLDIVGVASTGRVEAGIDYTITLVSNGTQKKLYLNGLLVLTTDDSTPANQVTFGNRNTDNARALKATYNNVVFFNKAFNDEEVFSIHNVLDDKPHTKFSALKWNALGDSITDANIYQIHVNSVLNFQTIRKYGVGGTSIADPTSTNTNSMVNRYVTMDNDADIVTVLGGTNDWGNNVVLESSNLKDKTTFKGALSVLCEGLLQKYPTKRILFITPPIRYNGSYTENDYSQQLNANGNTVEEFADAMIEICSKYGIPCLDLYRNCGWNKYNFTHFIPDGVHPNDVGHKRIASLIIDKMESVIY